MDDKISFLNDKIIDLSVQITAFADKHPIFKNLRINKSVSFYMKPGKVSDMIEKITNTLDNFWILNGCDLKIIFNDKELKPNDSMIEKGILHNSVVKVENNCRDFVTINDNYVCCNYDDPIEEVFIRYLKMTIKERIKFIPYLCDENGQSIKLNGTLRDAGLNRNSKLFVDFHHTGKECNIIFKQNKETLVLNPFCTLRMLKIWIMLNTDNWKPLHRMYLSGLGIDNYDEFEIVSIRNLSQIYMILK